MIRCLLLVLLFFYSGDYLFAQNPIQFISLKGYRAFYLDVVYSDHARDFLEQERIKRKSNSN